MRTPQERRSHVTEGEVLLELPCADIDQVMLFGNVQVTTQALQELLQHGIELSIFTFSGKLIGQLTPPKTKNIFLRIDQFQRQQDEQFCLRQGQHSVQQKIHGMIQILKGYQKNHPEAFAREELQQLEDFSAQAKAATTTASLLGIEGAASAAYFKLFGRMFQPPWQFSGRTRRPPKDPINAVLSFGYVIVGAELQSLLDGVGFDSYLGFYHTVAYGRPSLALDLLEEFRHSLVDRLALNLFNLGVMNADDFSPVPEGGIYLATSGKKKFFTHYERLLGQFRSDTDTAAKKPAYRAVFQQRIAELAQQVRLNEQPTGKLGLVDEDFDDLATP